MTIGGIEARHAAVLRMAALGAGAGRRVPERAGVLPRRQPARRHRRRPRSPADDGPRPGRDRDRRSAVLAVVMAASALGRRVRPPEAVQRRLQGHPGRQHRPPVPAQRDRRGGDRRRAGAHARGWRCSRPGSDGWPPPVASCGERSRSSPSSSPARAAAGSASPISPGSTRRRRRRWPCSARRRRSPSAIVVLVARRAQWLGDRPTSTPRLT